MLNAGHLMDIATKLALEGNKSLLGTVIKEGRVSNTAKKAFRAFEDISKLSLKNESLALEAIKECLSDIDKTEYSLWLERVDKAHGDILGAQENATNPLFENIHKAIVGNPLERAVALENIMEANKVRLSESEAKLPFNALDDMKKTSFVMEYGFADKSKKSEIYETHIKNALTYIVADLESGSVSPSDVIGSLKSLSEGHTPEVVFKLYEFNNTKKDERSE